MKILYAEDEKALSNAVAEILRMEKYEVDVVENGEQAWEHLSAGYYDAAVLDIMMPKMDGIQVLQKMREQENFTPVLLLTAKAGTEDRIEGLSAGADDYLAKPFSMGELLARLDSIIRRTTKYRVQQITCGNIRLNCDTDELQSEKGSLCLSGKETELLALLMKNEDVVFREEEIEEQLWQGENADNAVILYISYLKNKLMQIHADVQILQTAEGFVLKRV